MGTKMNIPAFVSLLSGWLWPPERVAPEKRNGGSHRPDWLLSEAGIFRLRGTLTDHERQTPEGNR